MKSHSGEQVNLLGSCFPVKGMSYERMLYAVRCLKSNEDMRGSYLHLISNTRIISSLRGSYLHLVFHIINIIIEKIVIIHSFADSKEMV